MNLSLARRAWARTLRPLVLDKERRDLAVVGGHRREPILPRAHRRERFDLEQRSLAAALQLEVDLFHET
jgi:hypothetical protein